jgi:hypothetical protein
MLKGMRWRAEKAKGEARLVEVSSMRGERRVVKCIVVIEGRNGVGEVRRMVGGDGGGVRMEIGGLYSWTKAWSEDVLTG